MVFEWIMGNFFPMMVMGLFAVFWLSFGMLQLPALQLGAPYATADDPSGLASPEYNAVVALYLTVWGFALFTFFVFTCKINVVFATIFLLVSAAAWVLSAAYWKVSWADYDGAAQLQKVCSRRPNPHVCVCMCVRSCWRTGRPTGGRRAVVCCRRAGLVHVLHHHGRRDAHHPEPARRRPEPLLAEHGRRPGGCRAASAPGLRRTLQDRSLGKITPGI